MEVGGRRNGGHTSCPQSLEQEAMVGNWPRCGSGSRPCVYLDVWSIGNVGYPFIVTSVWVVLSSPLGPPGSLCPLLPGAVFLSFPSFEK